MQVLFIIFSNLFTFILKHTQKYIDEFLGFVLVDWLIFGLQNFFEILHKLSVTHFVQLT